MFLLFTTIIPMELFKELSSNLPEVFHHFANTYFKQTQTQSYALTTPLVFFIDLSNQTYRKVSAYG